MNARVNARVGDKMVAKVDVDTRAEGRSLARLSRSY